VLGLVGLANRKEGLYSSELIASFLPLIRACEVLIQAQQCFRQIYEHAEVTVKLDIFKFKDPKIDHKNERPLTWNRAKRQKAVCENL
jgi:hypothetical protein